MPPYQQNHWELSSLYCLLQSDQPTDRNGVGELVTQLFTDTLGGVGMCCAFWLEQVLEVTVPWDPLKGLLKHGLPGPRHRVCGFGSFISNSSSAMGLLWGHSLRPSAERIPAWRTLAGLPRVSCSRDAVRNSCRPCSRAAKRVTPETETGTLIFLACSCWDARCLSNNV